MADLTGEQYYQLKHGNGLPNHPLGPFWNSDDEPTNYDSDEDDYDPEQLELFPEEDNSHKFFPLSKEEFKEMQDHLRSEIQKVKELETTVEDYRQRILALQKTNTLLKKLNTKLGKVEWTRRQACSIAPTITNEIAREKKSQI